MPIKFKNILPQTSFNRIKIISISLENQTSRKAMENWTLGKFKFKIFRANINTIKKIHNDFEKMYEVCVQRSKNLLNQNEKLIKSLQNSQKSNKMNINFLSSSKPKLES